MFSQPSWKRRLQPTLVPALVFVVVALMLTIVTRQLLTLQDESRHTQDVKDTLASITALMQEGENGMRGFLLTGDDGFLKPYNTASHEIGPALDRLQNLIDDNPVQRDNVSRLRPVVLERMSQLTRAVGYYQPGRTLPVPIGSGPETHARARDIIAAMMGEEDRILGERRRSVGRIATYLQLLAYGTLFIVMTVAIFALYRSQRQREELETAQEALRASNAKLSAEIGEREKVEDQLRQVQKMEAIGQLTGGIAHDFNNMLAVIIGALNIMQRRIDKGDMNVKEFMKAAMDGAMRGGALTQRLLAFARKQVLEPRALDVNKLVSGMSDLLRRTLGEMVQTEVVLAGGLWRVFVDAHQLETVILNLVVNARDAMPEGGKLTIETANAHLDEGYVGRHTDVPPGQYVLLCVSDTGTGMPPEVLQKAFDPFFTTKSAGRGTGLGLSQVYGFVRQSGGHVKIYSEPSHGATVKIYLPRHHGPAEESVAAKVSGALPQANNGEVVLVVEDEEAVRALTSEGLRDLGYEVLAAGGGADALKLLDQNPKIALLFTDIVMPEINGRQLADEAKKRRPDLKVLFTTGYTRNAVVHNGTLDPGVRLLGKPFTLEQLSRIVRDVLDGK
jgi:signal transduction histidine kinase